MYHCCGYAVVFPAEDGVGRDSFLSDDRLLLAVDDKISTGVVGTFPMVRDEMGIATVRAYHDRHVAQKDAQFCRTIRPLVHKICIERCLIREAARATVRRRDVADVAIALRNDRSLTLEITEQKRVAHVCTLAACDTQHRVGFDDVGHDAMKEIVKRV